MRALTALRCQPLPRLLQTLFGQTSCIFRPSDDKLSGFVPPEPEISDLERFKVERAARKAAEKADGERLGIKPKGRR